MRKDEFTKAASEHLQNLYDLVHSALEKKGDKEENCQQRYLLNSLFGVKNAIDGVEASDMKTIDSKG